MIIENKTTEMGDVLRISTDVPILGLTLLYGFTDNTVGEASDIYYQKKFRYSKDIGVTWSPWMDLTVANLESVPTDEKKGFLFEYTYEHEGKDGELYFNWVQLEGEIAQGDDTIYQKTDFSKFFDVNDINVLGWAFNVLEKLYQQGILPRYVQRNYSTDSEDFIAYWLTVTHFFAIIVYMARKFEDIPGNDILFTMFLEGKGLALTGDETQLQRNYLFSNYIDEYRKRGTVAIIGTDGTVNGEFLRLINYDSTEEFLFFNLVRQDLGWCLDYSSPMWTGTEQIVNAMKAYEYGETIKDVTVYPIVGSTDVFQHGAYEWIRLSQVAGTNGIGIGDAPSKAELLKMSPSLSYEIYFRVTSTSADGEAPDHLNFGVRGYGENLDVLPFMNAQTGAETESFFSTDTPRCIYKVGTEYWFRGVVLRADTVMNPALQLNFLNGVPLISNREMKYMAVLINQSYVSGDKQLLLRDIKVKPLELSVERGYLSSILPIATYFYNNSGRTDDYIKDFTERYLLGYKNNVLLPTYLTEVEVVFFVLTVTWEPTSGGSATGAGTYRQGNIATVRITPAIGYQINSVTIDGAVKTPSSQYLVSMMKNITVNITFKQTLMNFVTKKRAFSFEGTLYSGDLVIDWGDGVVTTNQLTHRYTDQLAQHIITVNEGSITTLNVPENEIISASFSNMPDIDVLNMDDNLLTELDISTLTKVTSVSISNNQLTSLSMTANPDINYLDLHGNALSVLDVTNLVKLRNLQLQENQLSALDLSKNTALINMNVDSNQLTSLDLSTNSALRTVTAYDNKIAAFTPPSTNNITELNVGKNLLKSLTLTNSTYPVLQELYVSDMTVMASLDCTDLDSLTILQARNNALITRYTVTGCGKLTDVDISSCQQLLAAIFSDNASLSKININNDTALRELDLENCAFSSLDLTTNSALVRLNIAFNRFVSFSAPYCTALEDLRCENNDLSSLTLTNNTNLLSLHCENNELPSLYLGSQTKLQSLYCAHNLLTDTSAQSWTATKAIIIIDAGYNNFTTFTYTDHSTLKTVNIDHCTKLATVNVNGNSSLTSLDLNGDTALTTLNAYENAIQTLNASGATNLTNVDIHSNQISTFNHDGCTKIAYINANQNLLTEFDPNYMEGNLVEMRMDQNKLSSLDFKSTVNLQHLSVNNNQLASLTFSPETGGGGGTTVEELFNKISTDPDLAYLFNGNTDKLERSVTQFTDFVGVKYAEGYEEGRQALSFDGSTYCRMGNIMSSDYVSKYLCGSVMIYPTSDFSVYTGIFGGVLFGLKTGRFGWAMGYGKDIFSNKLTIDFYTRGERGTLQGPVLQPNQWYHVAFDVRYMSSASNWKVSLWVNGQKYTTTQAPGGDSIDFSGLDNEYGENNIYFGRAYQSGWNYFHGKMQDLFVQIGSSGGITDAEVEMLWDYYKNVDAKRFAELKYVDCSHNQLTALDCSSIDYVETLDCSYNKLTSLGFGETLPSNKIKYLYASNNQLPSIDCARNTALITLDVSGNASLTEVIDIWSLSGLPNLITFKAYDTSLEGFTSFCMPLVEYCDVHNSKLSNFMPSPNISSHLQYVDWSETEVLAAHVNLLTAAGAKSIETLYLKNCTAFAAKAEVDMYMLQNLKTLDVSGSSLYYIEFGFGSDSSTPDPNAYAIEWYSIEGCKTMHSAQTFMLEKCKYFNFANSSVTLFELSDFTYTPFEEVRSEHSAMATDQTGVLQYALWITWQITERNGAKYYYADDDFLIGAAAVDEEMKAEIIKHFEERGWTLVLVD